MRGSSPIWPPSPHCPGITLPQYSCHQDPTESESHPHLEPLECSALFARANGVTQLTSCELFSVSPSSASATSLSPSMAKRRPRRRSSVVYPTPPSTTSSAKHAVPLPILPDHECGATTDPSSCPVAPSIAIVSPPSPSPLSPPPTSPIPVLSLPSPDDDSMSLLSRPLRLTASAPPLPRLTTGLLIPDPSFGSHAIPTPISPADRPPAPLDSIPEADDEAIRMERSNSSEGPPPTVVVNYSEMNDHNGPAMDLDMCEDAVSSSLLSFPHHHRHSPAPSPMTSNLGLFWDDQPVNQMPPSPHRPTADLPDLRLFSPAELPTFAPDASCHDHTPPVLPWGLSIPQGQPDHNLLAPQPSLLRIPQNPLASRWSPDTSSPSPGPDDEGEPSDASGRWEHPSTPSPRLPTWELPDLDMECFDTPDTPAWTSEPGSSRASTLESICVATPESALLEPSNWPEIQDPVSCAPSPRPTPKGLPPLVETHDEDSPMTSAEAEILLTSPSRRPVNLPTLTLDTRPQYNVVDNESSSRNMYHHIPGHPVYNAHFTTEPEPLSGFSTPNMISPLLRAFPAPGADHHDLLPALPLPELKRARSWPTPHPAMIALSEPPPRSSGLGLELGAPATPPSRECDLATDPLLRELGLAQAPPPHTEMGSLYGIRKRSLDAERTARGTEARIAARIRSLEASLLSRMHSADSDSGSVCSDSDMMDIDGSFPLRFELQTLLGLRADQKRMRKREKARAREIGALLRLKLAGMGGVRSMSMPHLASSSSILDSTHVPKDPTVEETKLAAHKVVELAAQMALRRRDAAGARPLLASNRERKGAHIPSPLMMTFGGSDDEESDLHPNAMAVE